jgi:hypothetical protein
MVLNHPINEKLDAASVLTRAIVDLTYILSCCLIEK